MRQGRMHLGVLVVALLAVAVPPAAGDTGSSGRAESPGDDKDSMFYFVGAHPDDEIVTWQLVDDFQEHYSVFITITRGERGASCLTAKQAQDYPFHTRDDTVSGKWAWGPYAYEGPKSPVGERDEGERRPLGNPWVGTNTRACGDAKVASWHWFLDAMAVVGTNRTRLLDGTGLPDFGIGADKRGDPYKDDDYQGRFCQADIPSRDGTGGGCADVWANELGARVAFDVGDAGWPPGAGPEYRDPIPFTESEVVAAVQAVRDNREQWGISELDEAGILATAGACDPDKEDPPEGDAGAHTDHETVNGAIYDNEFDGVGPRYGAVCDFGDYRFRADPGTVQQADPDTWWQLNAVAPQLEPKPSDPRDSGWNRRVGPVQVNYGWIGNGQPWDIPMSKAWKRYDQDSLSP